MIIDATGVTVTGEPQGSDHVTGEARLVQRLGDRARQFGRVLDALAEAVTVTEEDGRLVFANEAGVRRIGVGSLEEALALAPEDLLGRFELTEEDGSRLRPEDLPGRRLLRGEPPEPKLLRMVERATRRRTWMVVKAAELMDLQGERLAVNVLEDVTESKERELRERFLSHATEALSSSLDYEETLRAVARLAVPDLADWCSVQMLEDGALRQVAMAHIDPDKVAIAKRLRERYPPRLDDPTGVGAVIRTGRAEFYPSVPDDLLARTARDEEQLRLVRKLQVSSAIIAPMRARQQVVGTITLVAGEHLGAFDESDVAFVEDFAARAGTAIENARLYRERTLAAETLRQSLLPPELPRPPGWHVAARYHPASQNDQIGGDFYDVFPSTGGFTAVIGDVAGKGVGAAVLTALSRHALRTATTVGLEPTAAVGLLNRLLLEQPQLSLVTAIVARFVENARGAEVTLVSAGHPLPLRHRPPGPPAEIGAPGPVMGCASDMEWHQVSVPVASGETLLFYTDGLTDMPGEHDRYGRERLRRLISGCPAGAEPMLQRIDEAIEAFQSGVVGDDTALLALERE